MLGRRARTEDAGRREEICHVTPGVSNHLLCEAFSFLTETTFDGFTENKKISQSKFESVFMDNYYSINNHSFVNLCLHVNACLLRTTRNIDRNSRVTVYEYKSAINQLSIKA